MSVTVEYGFADESRKLLNNLSQSEATAAVEDFPWDQQLALFIQDDQGVGPEVRFTRSSDQQHRPEDLEAYASISKFEDESWLVVAGARMPGRFLSIFPITQKADIILDSISWQDVQSFIRQFYQDSRADLFAWMKKRA